MVQMMEEVRRTLHNDTDYVSSFLDGSNEDRLKIYEALLQTLAHIQNAELIISSTKSIQST